LAAEKMCFFVISLKKEYCLICLQIEFYKNI